MILTELSAPPTAAVPVRAFAEHLRLGTGFADDGAQDQVLELYLRAAMAAIEARIGRALLERRFAWTVGRWRAEATLALPVAPVSAIEAIALVDPEGVEMPLPVEEWFLARDGQRPRIGPRARGGLPKIPRGGHAAIRFVAGFGPVWASVPVDLQQAVFLLAAHYYENRAEPAQSAGSMPFGVLVLIEAYRSIRVGRGGA